MAKERAGRGWDLRNRGPLVLVASVVVVIVVVVVGSRLLGLWPDQRTPGGTFSTALAHLRAASSVPVQVAVARGAAQAIVARVRTDGSTPEERARDFVSDYRALFGLADLGSLTTGRVELDVADDSAAVLLQQSWRGVPIHGAQIAIPVDGEDALGSTGRLVTGLDLGVTPSLTGTDAIVAAIAARPGSDPVGEPRLTIFDPAVLGIGPPRARLAWEVVLDDPVERVFVDALDGDVIQRIGLTPSAFDLSVSDAQGSNAFDSFCFAQPAGMLLGTEAGPEPSHVGDPDAGTVAAEARATYDYFRDRLGRDSFDGAGGTLRMFIRAIFPGSDGTAVGNAHWVGGPCGVMEFSDGYASGDVITHEFTHAVVEHTAGLEYIWQSGALNESYADVFAYLRTGDPIMGESLPGGAIRDLSQPAVFDQPDQLSEILLPSFVGGELLDNGWVHYNSGIPNHAAYLLAHGGTHAGTGVTVKAIGPDRTAALYYASLNYLTAASDFIQQRIALEQAALALDFTSAEVCAVRNALGAVEIGVGDEDCDGNLDPGDGDGDFVIDKLDNCVDAANGDQADVDGDRVGDACDGAPDSSPRDGTAMRVINLWLEGHTLTVTDGPDGAAMAEIPYGEVSDWLAVPTDVARDAPSPLLVAAKDDAANVVTQAAELAFGDQVTVLAYRDDFDGVEGHAFWDRGEPDQFDLVFGHGPAWPEPVSGNATLLLYTGAISALGDFGTWYYGLDGECLVDAATGDVLSSPLGGSDRPTFASIEPGAHDLIASASGCDGQPRFGPLHFEAAASARIMVFPSGRGSDDLAMLLVPAEETAP